MRTRARSKLLARRLRKMGQLTKEKRDSKKISGLQLPVPFEQTAPGGRNGGRMVAPTTRPEERPHFPPGILFSVPR
jgi:hypothetical protein